MASFNLLERASDLFHDAKRTLFGDDKAEEIRQTYRTDGLTNEDVNPADFASGKGALIRADRGMIGSELITETPGFEKIAHNKDVEYLLGDLYSFRMLLKSKKLPSATADPTGFKAELAAGVGDTVETLMSLQEKLIRGAELFNNKSRRYRHVAAACASGATRIKGQIDLCNRVLEMGLRYAENNFQGGNFPEGKSLEAVLLDPSFAYLNTYGADDFAGVVGSGGINTVKKVTEDGQARVFKEGSVRLTGETASQQTAIFSVVERMTGEKMGKDAEESYQNASQQEINSSYRDAAVSVVDRLFGLKAAVGTSLARSSTGHQASVMDMAQGKTASGTYSYFGKEEEAIARMQKGVSTLVSGVRLEGMDEAQKQQAIASDASLDEIVSASQKEMINLDDDTLMSSAMNMAALDIIVGHVDRHVGNYMVSQEHGFIGIDNDTSFSMREAAGIFGERVEGAGGDHFNEFNQKVHSKFVANHTEMQNSKAAMQTFDTNFPVVPAALRDKILSVRPDTLASSLRGLVGAPQIEAAVGRLKALQDYMSSLPPEKIIGGGFTEQQRSDYVRDETFGLYGNYLAEAHNVSKDDVGSVAKSASMRGLAELLKAAPKVRAFYDENQEVLKATWDSLSLSRMITEAIYNRYLEDSNYNIEKDYKDEGPNGLQALLIRMLKAYIERVEASKSAAKTTTAV
ncbi:MAG: hypothetical protein K6E81_03295 [Lachnospiraceae bacterium]|nr:hypothetical protein [Lachnospiraceae bacterium]